MKLYTTDVDRIDFGHQKFNHEATLLQGFDTKEDYGFCSARIFFKGVFHDITGKQKPCVITNVYLSSDFPKAVEDFNNEIKQMLINGIRLDNGKRK